MANSRSVTWPNTPAPISSSEITGSADASVVLIERSSTWLVETLMRSPAVMPGGGDAPLVVADAVEHDDAVVQRVAEDGEERDDGGRRDLEAEHRVDADADDDVVDHRQDRRQRHPPLEAERDVQGDQAEEHDQRGDRLPGDLLAPRRADRRHADVGRSTPAASANASWSWTRTSSGWSSTCTLMMSPLSELRSWILAVSLSRPLSVEDLAGVVDGELAGRHVPRHAALEVDAEDEAARATSDTAVRRAGRPEISSQTRRRPQKSIAVWARTSRRPRRPGDAHDRGPRAPPVMRRRRRRTAASAGRARTGRGGRGARCRPAG